MRLNFLPKRKTEVEKLEEEKARVEISLLQEQHRQLRKRQEDIPDTWHETDEQYMRRLRGIRK